MSQIIGLSMPKGYAGELTRGSFDHTTEVHPNNGTTPVAAFGIAVKLAADGSLAPCAAASDNVYGFSVRTFDQVDNAGVPMLKNLVTVLRRGYIAVTVASGTPAIGAQAYLTSAGAISAASSNNTAITGATFMGPAENGIAEIAFNI